MSRHEQTILVLGATGQQGGAAVKRLLTDGWKVRALTRSRHSDGAKVLVAKGAEVIEGDTDDRASMDAAVRNVYGVFSAHAGSYAGGPYEKDPRHEVRSAHNVAEAARAAGVRLVVHSSADGVGTELESKLPILQMKAEAEKQFATAGVSVTVLRPTSFMENMVTSDRGLRDGALSSPMLGDKEDELISVEDIGAFAALAFADPEKFAGQTLALAGDSLTQLEIAAAIGKAFDREVPFVHVPLEQIRAMSEQFAEIVDAVNHHEGGVDIPALRKLHPGLLTFDAWLRGPGRARLQQYFDRLDQSA